MSNALTTQNGAPVAQKQLALTPDEIALVKRTVLDEGATDDELKLFVAQANKRGLDPLARQIYGIKIQGRLTCMVSIDGLRLIAQRSGEYAGQDAPLWCGEDGEWRDVWLGTEPPAAAKITVYRRGQHGTTAVARYASYVQRTKGGEPSRFWLAMPDVMLSKCAESLALRKAFPQELSGLYSMEEMGQARHEAAPAIPDRTPATRPRPQAAAPVASKPPRGQQSAATARAAALETYTAACREQGRLPEPLDPKIVTRTELHAATLRIYQRPRLCTVCLETFDDFVEAASESADGAAYCDVHQPEPGEELALAQPAGEAA